MNNQRALQSKTDSRKNDLRKKHEVYTTKKEELQQEFATIPQGCTMNSTQRKMLKQFRKTHDELRGLELLQKKEKEIVEQQQQDPTVLILEKLLPQIDMLSSSMKELSKRCSDQEERLNALIKKNQLN